MNAVEKLKVLHVISGLRRGGAELFLYRHLRSMPAWIVPMVVSLSAESEIAQDIRKLGVEVLSVDVHGRPVSGLLAALKRSRSFDPDIAVGWMYHGNLAASLLGSLCGVRSVMWNIRHTVRHLKDERISTSLSIRMGGTRLFRPEAVIFNSYQGKTSHERYGYGRHQGVVIRNGVDTSWFRPDSVDKPLESPVHMTFGFFARYHPMKGIEIMLGAARVLAKEGWPFSIIMAGQGMAAENAVVTDLVKQYGLERYITLEGECADMRSLYARVHCTISSSLYGEGVSNVMLESMASGVPVIGSAVGDTPDIIGDPQWVVPPNDVDQLIVVMRKFMRLDNSERTQLGAQLRERVKTEFSEKACTDLYLKLYREKSGLAYDPN
jgi:glycosyltransferase involved in cell wall biosynthesis